MHARFLLGPAGSGKTHRCLEEIRTELKRSPDGPPLLLLAPKQATFQLERQLLSDPSLAGYSRLQILSFERLAQFVLGEFQIATPGLLNEEGRVMVMRALLLRHQGELQIFRASARLAGFAQQLSLLLREFQRHKLPPARLEELAGRAELAPPLRAKLHDLALLLRAYAGWLQSNRLQDDSYLLDAATETLRAQSAIDYGRPNFGQLAISGLWLDGFAEMTPQELDLLTALLPFCERATLAFCLAGRPETEPSWLSTWSVVAQTFRRCHAQLAAMDGVKVDFETLANAPGKGRFASNEPLRTLEANWSQPTANPGLGTRNWKLGTGNLPVRLVECADSEAEAVFAAREILRHVRAGGRFRECAVIVRSLEPYHAGLARVFRRYEIPVFLDRREGVAHHPLAELTRFALRTALYNWRRDDWFGALKTGLVPAEDNEIDRLENAALARGWEGKAWREPLPEPHLETLRLQLVPPFEKFADALVANSAAPTGAQMAETIRGLWRDLAVEEVLQAWSATGREESAIHATVFVQMHAWLENLERAFAAEPLPLRDWLSILEAGLANLTVGVVPPALDQVLIGAIDRSRNPDLKLALLLGLNEGVFPAPPAPATLLTDADRDGLEKADIYLGPTARQRLGHERYLGYIACTRPSERLVLAWSAKDTDGEVLNPSPFIALVKQITGVSEETFSGVDDWAQAEHVCELEASLRRLDDGEVLPKLVSLAPLAEKWRQVKQAATAENLAPSLVERLFGRELKTSVSALEEFAACPFKFFTARGLKLRERKEFQFDARDKGSFQHGVLEEFHNRVRASGREWRDLTPAEAGNLAAEIGRELLPGYENGKFLADGEARFTGDYMVDRMRRLMTALVAWTPQYGFDPVKCEAAFDNDVPDGLPAWRLDLGGGRALLLRGRVDRVDLFKHGDGSALAVVMDYKSSVRKLDDTRLYHGLELQLLSYLGMLKNLASPERFFSVKSLTPAGVFYVPLNGGAEKISAARAEVLAANEDRRRAAYQHSGRFLGDELAHLDNRNVLKGDQFRYAKKKAGAFSLVGNEALPAAEFEALRESVEAHLRGYGIRIFSGEVNVAPYRIGNATACDYCDFRPVCRFDPWVEPFRVLRPPPKKGRPA